MRINGINQNYAQNKQQNFTGNGKIVQLIVDGVNYVAEKTPVMVEEKSFFREIYENILGVKNIEKVQEIKETVIADLNGFFKECIDAGKKIKFLKIKDGEEFIPDDTKYLIENIEMMGGNIKGYQSKIFNQYGGHSEEIRTRELMQTGESTSNKIIVLDKGELHDNAYAEKIACPNLFQYGDSKTKNSSGDFLKQHDRSFSVNPKVGFIELFDDSKSESPKYFKYFFNDIENVINPIKPIEGRTNYYKS